MKSCYPYLALCFLLLLGVSCEKDPLFSPGPSPDLINPNKVYSAAQHPLDKTGSGEIPIVFPSISDIPPLQANLQAALGVYGKNKHSDEFDGEIIETVVDPQAGNRVYVMFLDAIDGYLYKLYMQTDHEYNIEQMGVLQIQISGTFQQAVYDHDDSARFEGTLKITKVEDFLRLKNGDINASQLEDCLTLIFGDGSGGSGGPSSGTYPTGTDGDDFTTLIPDGCTVEGFTVVCGCSPSHVGGSSSSACQCRKPDIVTSIHIICPFTDGEPGPSEKSKHNSNFQKDNSYWDCIEYLISVNMLTDRDILKNALMRCEGLNDPNDNGAGNPNNIPFMQDLCTAWMAYKQDCFPDGLLRQVTTLWANLLAVNSNAFYYLLENDYNCSGPAIANLILANPDLHLDDDDLQLLIVNPEFIEPLMNLLNTSENRDDLLEIAGILLDGPQHPPTLTPEIIDAVDIFLEEHPNYLFSESIDAIKGFLELRNLDSDYKIERFEELFDLIESDPNAFVNDCMDDQDNPLNLIDYSALFNFNIAPQCANRLDNLGSGFFNQPIGNGSSSLTNVDYYGVTILAYPDFNDDGNPDSQADMFDAIQSNFPDLASGGAPSFSSQCAALPTANNLAWTFSGYPFPDNPSSEIDRWNSSHPLSTIFLINADVDFPHSLVADDGAVITSQYTDGCCWVFSTIHTPESSTQPLAGNRQFGLRVNNDGRYEFYTRAIDRARITDVMAFGIFAMRDYNRDPECAAKDYFDIGVLTWNNLQNEVAAFVIANGGNAQVNTPLHLRVDYGSLYTLLKSDDIITSIPCD